MPSLPFIVDLRCKEINGHDCTTCADFIPINSKRKVQVFPADSQIWKLFIWKLDANQTGSVILFLCEWLYLILNDVGVFTQISKVALKMANQHVWSLRPTPVIFEIIFNILQVTMYIPSRPWAEAMTHATKSVSARHNKEVGTPDKRGTQWHAPATSCFGHCEIRSLRLYVVD